MKEKTKRAIAIVDLVFVVIGVISFTVYLYNPDLFEGTFGYLALFFGGFGLAIFAVLYLLGRHEKRAKERDELLAAKERAEREAAGNGTDNGAEEIESAPDTADEVPPESASDTADEVPEAKSGD